VFESAWLGAFASDDSTVTVTRTSFINKRYNYNRSKDRTCGVASLCAMQSASLECTDCFFTNNSASVPNLKNYAEADDPGYLRGVAVYVSTPNAVVFKNASFVENSGVIYSGAVYADVSSTFRCEGCEFVRNSAIYGGAVAAALGARVALANSVFLANSGTLGGAVYMQGGRVTAGNCTFAENRGGFGGVFFMHYFSARVEIAGCTVVRNYAKMGGCLAAYDMYEAAFEDSLFVQNSAEEAGGVVALLPDGHINLRRVSMVGSNFTGNLASGSYDSAGGVAYLAQPFDFIASKNRFIGSSANIGGTFAMIQSFQYKDFSGVASPPDSYSFFSLVDVLIQGSRAALYGGAISTGISNHIGLSIQDSEFINNTANEISDIHINVDVYTQFTVKRTRFAGGRAVQYGATFMRLWVPDSSILDDPGFFNCTWEDIEVSSGGAVITVSLALTSPFRLHC
jgi:hypothetical protein